MNGKRLFTLVDQEGLPLDIILEILKNNNITPNWYEFLQVAVKHWKPSTIYSKTSEAVKEVYSEDYFKEWDKRIRFCLGDINALSMDT